VVVVSVDPVFAGASPVVGAGAVDVPDTSVVAAGTVSIAAGVESVAVVDVASGVMTIGELIEPTESVNI